MKNKSDLATTVGADPKSTEVGSVFVSNYPPYSFWSREHLDAAREALASPPAPDTPLGLYMHIPFCRRRCKFCYFKVYTDKNSRDVGTYLDALGREMELYASRQAIAGRPLKFVYVGGGTPSFLSTKQLRAMVARLQSSVSWDGVEEVTFECEPGTLTQAKLEAIREVGVTRLSLGVESFDDEILRENGRAHVSKEIFRVAPWIQELDFPQVNIDLIAGMVGETWESWRESVRKAIEMEPDSVTVYQMELPFNTVYSKQVLGGSGMPVADWETKRAWHDYAFEQFEQAGYEISSAYTVVNKKKRGSDFVYRHSVWHGCDLVSIGVSSFGHIGGVHYQNLARWQDYLDAIAEDRLPLDRAFPTEPRDRLIRELILQMKLGRVPTDYFQRKFGSDVVEEFAAPLQRLERRGMIEPLNGEIRLTRQGLLRVDSLLPEFYAETYQNARYT